MRRYFSLHVAFLVAISYVTMSAAEDEPLLIDRNGDGKVAVFSFGDSITFGVGDTGIDAESSEKGGYPKRTQALLSIPFENDGQPGEMLTSSGATRYVSDASQSDGDFAIVIEGANDAYNQVDSLTFRDSLQRVINASSILGKAPILATLPRPCVEHAALVSYTSAYSDEVRELSIVNGLPFIDFEKAWKTTCENPDACELYNLPEGLHPNAQGYEVMSQAVAAKFLGIDIFSSDGAKQLESALGLPAGTVKIKPETVAQ